MITVSKRILSNHSYIMVQIPQNSNLTLYLRGSIGLNIYPSLLYLNPSHGTKAVLIMFVLFPQ